MKQVVVICRGRTAPVLALALVLVFCAASACTNWEHRTYATLNASKAVIDQAGADYNAGKLSQTKAVHDLIQAARDAQTVAVHSFESYAVAKVGGADPTELAKLQQSVMDATNAVLALVGDIKKLKGGA